MSFTRLIYDTKAYETDLQQNMAPIYYTLNPVKNKHENKEVVYKPGFNISHPPVISKFNNIDIESELQRLYYKNTRYPGYKFSPDCDLDNNCNTGYPCGCENTDCNHLKQYKENTFLQTEYSRQEIDVEKFRDKCVLERNFDFLNLDSQKLNRVIYDENIRGGVDTRNKLKDNFKPCLKNIKNQDNILPHQNVPNHVHAGNWTHNHNKHGA